MAGYIGNIPVPQGTQTRQNFTATASQTPFPTIGYTAGFIDVYLNGVKLVSGTDFTASNGSDVVLATAAAADDVLDVVIFDTFNTSSGTFSATTLKNNVTLKNDTEQDTDGGRASKIIYQGEQSGGEITTLAEIEASHDGTADDEAGDLIIRVNDGNDGASPTERLRLDSNGTLGVGCVPNVIQGGFDTVQIGGNLTLNVDGTGAGAGVYMGNNVYRDSGNSRWEHIYTDKATQYVQAGGDHIYRRAASGTADTAITWVEKARINEHGLTFNGDTAAANALDDYEEGEWTAAFSVGGGSLTVHNSYKTGLYQKIGNTVFVSIHIRSSADSSPSGGVVITGLPFAASSTTKSRFSMGILPHFGLTGMGGDEIVGGYITEGQSFVQLFTQNGNNLTTTMANRMTSSVELYLSGHYRVA